jgi:hypothetical protein
LEFANPLQWIYSNTHYSGYIQTHCQKNKKIIEQKGQFFIQSEYWSSSMCYSCFVELLTITDSSYIPKTNRRYRGRDHKVVGYITICAISAYITTNVVSSNPAHCIMFGLWFMVFNTTFNNISVISWWRKPEYSENITDVSQVTD